MNNDDDLEARLFSAREKLGKKYGYVQSWRSVSDRSTMFICGNVVVRLTDDDLEEAADPYPLIDALIQLKLGAIELGRLAFAPKPIDPLDIAHDGCALRDLLQYDERNRREEGQNLHYTLTPNQRAAVSAHWSAQLRAKVDATKQADQAQVVCDWQDEP